MLAGRCSLVLSFLYDGFLWLSSRRRRRWEKAALQAVLWPTFRVMDAETERPGTQKLRHSTPRLKMEMLFIQKDRYGSGKGNIFLPFLHGTNAGRAAGLVPDTGTTARSRKQRFYANVWACELS